MCDLFLVFLKRTWKTLKIASYLLGFSSETFKVPWMDILKNCVCTQTHPKDSSLLILPANVVAFFQYFTFRSRYFWKQVFFFLFLKFLVCEEALCIFRVHGTRPFFLFENNLPIPSSLIQIRLIKVKIKCYCYEYYWCATTSISSSLITCSHHVSLFHSIKVLSMIFMFLLFFFGWYGCSTTTIYCYIHLTA